MRLTSLFSIFSPILSIFLEPECTPVYIALRQQNIPILPEILQTISNPVSNKYGEWLTAKEIHNIVDAKYSDQQLVMDWVRSYHAKNLVNHGDSISFCLHPSILVSMFNIPIQFRGSKIVLKSYTIPKHLLHSIDFIEMHATGLNLGIKQQPPASPYNMADDRYFGLESLEYIYGTSNISTNMSIKTAAIEFQNNQGYTSVDMNMQRKLNGITSTKVERNIGGNTGYDFESELDVQMLSMVNGESKLWYWNNPYWLYSFAVEFEKTLIKPNIISLSWGWSERNQCDIIDCVNITSEQYVARVNTEFLKMALQGTTIVVASGDAGAPGRTNEGCDAGSPINPVFPGSSPYVLSIGATYVEKDNRMLNFSTPLCQNHSCVTGNIEQTISYDNVGWTAGGGFDSYQNKTPWWQLDAVTGYLASGVGLPPDENYNKNGRAYPDVAAVGHSCPTVVNKGLLSIDGTSCSAPVVGGLLTYVWDTLWREHKIKLGFANPLIYYIQRQCPECFNDITTGYNWCTESACCENKTSYGFSATMGFDPVTGLGSLNIDKITSFITTMLR
tara:strand:+ start:1450 stop:3123 length:1674 start_codon:yes stop_codon:yes gene_type:complete